MTYKGYTARVAYDDSVGVFHGRVLGIRDVIGFEATNVRDLKRAFRNSLDEYLAFCEEDGVSPERPFSGEFRLRVDKEMHRTLATTAESEGISLNELISQILSKELKERGVH